MPPLELILQLGGAPAELVLIAWLAVEVRRLRQELMGVTARVVRLEDHQRHAAA